ncbi:MAG: hypothetical protein WBK51_14070 [Polaromonas sp.]
MDKKSSSKSHEAVVTNASALKEQRLQQLMESCGQEVLKQIVGPFGLTPAMFEDKDGGNVTTQRNAEQGVYAKDSEKLDRRKDYDYSLAKSKKKSDAVRDGNMNSQEFVDSYTDKLESTKRLDKNGKLVMNAELDHTVPIAEIHAEGGWMKDKLGRDELSSIEENLNYTTYKANRRKGAKAPEDALSSENGFDKNLVEPLTEKARVAIDEKLPTTSERIKYHGGELLTTGAEQAGLNALRQAFGVLLHEFANGSFVEIKVLLVNKDDDQNLIDQLIESLKRVMHRVVNKLKSALDALVQGGAQGFISNVLTFLINNLITTAKKFVTIVREGMQGLWQAIKLMLNPPEGMPGIEVARQAMKIIATVVTTGLGLMLEESVKGFILTIPLLLPIADILSAALTAIITGVVSALVVYGLDTLFDWLSSSDTESLQAYEENANLQMNIVVQMQEWLELQFNQSRQYEVCELEYQQINKSYSTADARLTAASRSAGESSTNRNAVIDSFTTQLERQKLLSAALGSL